MMFERFRKSWNNFSNKPNLKNLGVTLLDDIIIHGVILNFVVFAIFKLSFTYYSWLGYGFLIYLIKELIPEIIENYRIK